MLVFENLGNQYELETGSSNAQLLPRQRGMTQGP